ncbi:MAG: WXG100 family type VII secretion target [Lachnospiraceae bacterium]|nr:WXG100 family type VII secretion target [Lachnospiraceae bacterium]
MADLILKVTPEEVRAKASDIDSQKTFMTTYLSDMQGKINQLQDAWNSPSGQEYYTKFTTLAKQIEAALDDLAQHVTNLNEAASKYEEAENQQKSLVEGLSTEGVF